MLSEEEKREMLEDAGSMKRRDDFRRLKSADRRLSLDEFIAYLDGIQKVFGPFSVSDKKVMTAQNKL